MKFLKRLGLGLLIVAALLLGGSLFLPGKVHVERHAVIHAQPEKIFEQLNVLTNWEVWSPWHKLDPKMKLTYSGPASGTGAKYAWASEQHNVGNGTLTITKSVPNQTLETAMHFDNGDGVAQFQLQPVSDGTSVAWGMDTDMGRNPMARYIGLLLDRMIGPDFERGLNNLKAVCEPKGGSI